MIWLIGILPGEDESPRMMLEDLSVPLEPRDSYRDPFPVADVFPGNESQVNGGANRGLPRVGIPRDDVVGSVDLPE